MQDLNIHVNIKIISFIGIQLICPLYYIHVNEIYEITS